MASIKELQPLITEPREDLDAEYKDWLDLTGNERHKAKLAKAAIALANHGGGHIVIGFKDKGLISRPRPREIPEITQDSVNAAIRRYVNSEFHCKMYNVPHPDTDVSHPVVIIPSMPTPVMSRRDYQGEIVQNSYYIRKPGPRSEEPRTEGEWRVLLNRCMMEANRSTTGSVEAQNSMSNSLDDLQPYCTAAHDRWKELVSGEEDHSPARFPHGYYEMAFSLIGATPANSLDELRNRLSDAGRVDLSGWPPFLYASGQARPHDDFVEAWLGQPDHNDRRHRESYQYDFWRASRDGKLYTIRGYREDDERDHKPPGRMFHVTLPIWRVGEGLLFANRFATTFEEVDQIAVYCRFAGLENRCLVFTHSNVLLPMGNPCSTGEVMLTGQITQQQVQDDLAEVLHPLLRPLYEKFDFYELSFDQVAKELQHLRRGL